MTHGLINVKTLALKPHRAVDFKIKTAGRTVAACSSFYFHFHLSLQKCEASSQ